MLIHTLRPHWQWLVGVIITTLLTLMVFRVTASPLGDNHYPALDPTFQGAGTADVVMGDQLSPVDLITFDSGKILTFSSDGGIYQRLANGQPDLTFGTNGRILLFTPQGTFYPARVVRDTQGRFIFAGIEVGGGPKPTLGQDAFILARILPNGTPDSSFGTGGFVPVPLGSNSSGNIRRLLQQPDGKLLILTAGKFTGASVLYRALEDGTPDPTFEGDGSVNLPVGVVQDMALQPNGILIAGIEYEGTPAGFLRRQQLSDGTADLTFGDNGTAVVEVPDAANSTLDAITIAPSTKIVVAGTTFLAGESRFFAAQLSANGILDATFNEDGIASIQFPTNVPDGSVLKDVMATAEGVLLVGTAGSGGLSGRTAAFVKSTPTGDVDTTFAEDGFFYNYVYRLESATVGVVNAAGDYFIGGERFGAAVLKLSAMGIPNRTYGASGYYSVGITTPTQGGRFFSQSDGKRVIVARMGDFPTFATGTLLLRTNADGTLDSTYGVNGVAIAPTPTPIPNGSNSEPAVGATIDSNNRTLLAGYMETGFAAYTAVLTRLTATGTLDTDFGTNGFLPFGIANREQAHAITIDEDENLLTAGRLFSDTEPQSLILHRLLPNGEPDPTFGTTGTTVIANCPMVSYVNIAQQSSIHYLSNGKIMVSAVCDRGSDTAYYLFRFNQNGTLDTTYGTAGQAALPIFVTDINVDDDGTVTTVASRRFNTTQYWQAAQFTPEGVPNPAFGTNGVTEYSVPGLTDSLYATALAQQPNGNWLLVGYVYEDSFNNDLHFASLFPNGTLDSTFGTEGFERIDMVRGDLPSDVAVSENTALLTGSFNLNGNSGEVALTVARFLVYDAAPPTPTATAVPPTPTATATPTQTPTPQSRALYLPLTQRGN